MQPDFFIDICKTLSLGELQTPVVAVSGGYMHKMYRMETAQGTYAVKLLNPSVMQRPDVFRNLHLAEILEQELQNAHIPIVPANIYNGEKMQCLQNQYFYVFDWLDGKALHDGAIKPKHCEIMGSILARIHGIPCDASVPPSEIPTVDWDFYIQKSETDCPKIAKKLYTHRDLLYRRTENGARALQNLPQEACISNGDMDSKNVLWQAGKPYLIDLESLSYGNPHTELFQLALCWAGYESCHLRYRRLEAFLRGYRSVCGEIQTDWELLYDSNIGSLLWLEYNLKRALKIECADEAEQALGIGQVKETLQHIRYYQKIREPLLRHLNASFK